MNISSMNLNYKKFHLQHNKSSSKQGFVSVRDKIHNNKQYESKYYLTNISQINHINTNNNNGYVKENKYISDIYDNIIHTTYNTHNNNNNHCHRKYKTQTYRNEHYIKKAKTQSNFLASECEVTSIKGNTNRLMSLNTQSSNYKRRKVSFFSKQGKDNNDNVLFSSNSNKKMLLKVNKSPVKIMSVKTGFVYTDKCNSNNKGMSSRLLMLREIRNVHNKENKELTEQMKSRVGYSKDERKRVKTSRFPRYALTKSSFGYLRSEFE
jgi:hypothetical protein